MLYDKGGVGGLSFEPVMHTMASLLLHDCKPVLSSSFCMMSAVCMTRILLYMFSPTQMLEDGVGQIVKSCLHEWPS